MSTNVFTLLGKGGIPTYPPVVIDIKKVIPDKDYGPKPKLPPRRGISNEGMFVRCQPYFQ